MRTSLVLLSESPPHFRPGWIIPPPAYHPSTQKLPGRGRGRPKYDLDLDRALELHDMELSWDQVAKAMGVTRQTLYNQLNASGRSTARRPFTNIGDDDLDLLIAEISDHHPLAGSVIVRGHLEAIGVHVPLNDIKDSLRRVNAIGVSLGWDVAYFTPSRRIRSTHRGHSNLRHHPVMSMWVTPIITPSGAGVV